MAGSRQPKYPIPGKPYGGFEPPPVNRTHVRLGYAAGVTLWLWVLYRAKQDLPHMLGISKPWDHHHGPHDDHGHDSSNTH